MAPPVRPLYCNCKLSSLGLPLVYCTGAYFLATAGSLRDAKHEPTATEKPLYTFLHIHAALLTLVALGGLFARPMLLAAGAVRGAKAVTPEWEAITMVTRSARLPPPIADRA